MIVLQVPPEQVGEINRLLEKHRAMLRKDLANWYRRAHLQYQQGRAVIKVPTEIKQKQSLLEGLVGIGQR